MANETEQEELCTRCGLCCHFKAWASDGTVVIIHPTQACPFLGDDNLCTVYEERFEKNPYCMSREEMTTRDYSLPDSCPYCKAIPGYKSAKVVTEEEFEELGCPGVDAEAQRAAEAEFLVERMERKA